MSGPPSINVGVNSLFTPQQSFVQRLINAQITFSGQTSGQPTTTGTTGPSPGGPTAGTTLSISGKRTKVVVSNNAGSSNNTLEMWIYGLSPQVLNQASTCGISYNFGINNKILVTAGTSISGMIQVFQGLITFALPDYNKQPDVPLYIQATAGGLYGQFGRKVASFTGTADVATMMQGFATTLGITNFENNNVNVKIANPYFSGDTWSQVQQLAQHAYVNAALVDGGGTLAIWPKGKMRTSQTNVPLISKDTGMIGYPTFDPHFLHVKMLFNPNVKLGGNIQVQSSIQQANGTWTVSGYSIVLESLVPHGQWMGEALCYNAIGSPPPNASNIPSPSG